MTLLSLDEITFYNYYKKFCKCKNSNNELSIINYLITKTNDKMILDGLDIMRYRVNTYKEDILTDENYEIKYKILAEHVSIVKEMIENDITLDDIEDDSGKPPINKVLTNNIKELNNHIDYDINDIDLDSITLEEIQRTRKLKLPYPETPLEILIPIKEEIMNKIKSFDPDVFEFIKSREKEYYHAGGNWYDFTENNTNEPTIEELFIYKSDDRNSKFRNMEKIAHCIVTEKNIHLVIMGLYSLMDSYHGEINQTQFFDLFLSSPDAKIMTKKTLYKNLIKYHFFDYIIVSLYKHTGKYLNVKRNYKTHINNFHLLLKRYRIIIFGLNIYTKMNELFNEKIIKTITV